MIVVYDQLLPDYCERDVEAVYGCFARKHISEIKQRRMRSMRLVEKIKKNYEENKKLYISIGVGVIVSFGFIVGAKFHGRAMRRYMSERHVFTMVDEAENIFKDLSIAEAKVLAKELNGEFMDALLVFTEEQRILIIQEIIEG